MKKLLLLSAILTVSVQAQEGWDPFQTLNKGNRPISIRSGETYIEAIKRTASMVSEDRANRYASERGLNILNLTWEDTGRYKGSSVGPNISDMTIQVGAQNPETRRYEVTCMPVIRYPNFSDKTGDINPDNFTLMVGNQDGSRLQRVSLTEFLQNPAEFLSDPESWRGSRRTLWSPRDTHVLTSAQACFLPVPRNGKATFNPVLFNYQSSAGNPAVLTILATREGTSVTVIDNKRDTFPFGARWGQRLFHNQNGMRASLTGERMSDFLSKGGGSRNAPSAGLNMALLIQVPLKYREMHRHMPMMEGAPAGMAGGGGADMAKRGSDVENAVIGHGQIEGPFTEIDNLAIERDERFPIRVTVQFYKATATGNVSPDDMDEIQRSIDSVYARADMVGSLVTDGHTGRPTEYWGMKVQPAGWWSDFWQRHERNTGQSPREAISQLQRLLGRDYQRKPVCELYLRDLIKR